MGSDRPRRLLKLIAVLVIVVVGLGVLLVTGSSPAGKTHDNAVAVTRQERKGRVTAISDRDR